MHSQSLWSFTVACYAEPTIEPLLLAAQDQGHSVCVLLTAAWLEQRGCAWSAARQAQLSHSAAQWNTPIIEPLRALRIEWKSQLEKLPALAPLREQLKALELAAEQQLLQSLESDCLPWETASQPSDWLTAMGLSASQLDTLRQAAARAYLA